jgi:hypothetical protein
MGFRFRSLRLLSGLGLDVSRPVTSTLVGRFVAWLAIGRRGSAATVGIAGPALSYAEQSPWRRPTPTSVHGAPGIEVAELPRIEIDVPPVSEPPPPRAEPAADDDAAQADPLLMPIALLIVALVTAAAVIWAALV